MQPFYRMKASEVQDMSAVILCWYARMAQLPGSAVTYPISGSSSATHGV